MEAFKNARGWKPKVDVLVCEVTSPVSFVIREAPGRHYSQCGRDFLSMELKMKQIIKKWDIEPLHPLLPEIGSVVLVKNPSNFEWCRARVNKIFDTTSGYQVEVTLVDFGGTFMVGRKMLREVPNQELLDAPFQCVEFFLPGLRPVKWTIDKATITTKYVPGNSWDSAAVDYVKCAMSKATQVQVQVLGKTASGRLYGKLLLCLNNQEFVLNDELVKQDFAFVDPAAVIEDDAPVREASPTAGGHEPPPALEPPVAATAVQVLAKERQMAMTAMFQEMFDIAKRPALSSLLRIPVEMAVKESPPLSPSSSVATSPTPSCASTSLSVGPFSTGMGTPPTTPGLGRGLSLLLRLKELGAYGPSNKPGTAKCGDVEAGTVSGNLGGHSAPGAANGVTAVMPPPALERAKDTEWAPAPTEALKFVCRPTPPPLSRVVGPEDVGEPKARGRARLLQLALQHSGKSPQPGRGVMAMPTQVSGDSPTMRSLSASCSSSGQPVASTGVSTSSQKHAPGGDQAALRRRLAVASEVSGSCAPNSTSPHWGQANVSSHRTVGSGPVPPNVEMTKQSTPSRAAAVQVSFEQMCLDEVDKEHVHIQDDASQSGLGQVGKDSKDDQQLPAASKASRLKALLQKTKRYSLVPRPTSQDSEPCGQKNASSVQQQAENMPKLVPASEVSVAPHVLSSGLLASKTSPGIAESQEVAAPRTSSRPASRSSDVSDFVALHTLGERPVDPAFIEQATDASAFQEPDDLRCSDSETPDAVPPYSDPCAQWSGPVNFSTDYSAFNLEPVCSPVRALCRGIMQPLPCTHLDQTHFDDSVKNRLISLGIRSPTSIQSLTWPAVLTGRNVVAVGPPHSGKTFSYLVPLVSRIIMENDYKHLPSCCGPKMVILTSSWMGAQRVFDQLKMLVGEQRDPKCNVLYAGGAEIGREVKIVNECDILVATPNSFLRYMFNYNRMILSLDRCCHLVLDDAERLLEKYPAEVATMASELQECMPRRNKRVRMVQVVVCSTRWTSSLEYFLQATPIAACPVIVLGSFFEAAVYAKVHTITSFVSRGAHRETFLGIVEGNLRKKMVVCTADRKTAIAVHQLLLKASVYSMLLFEDLTMTKIRDVISEWTAAHERSQTPILVIQDKLLPLANVRDAKLLIHFDIPVESKFNFGFRYSCISDHMLDPKEQSNPVRVADGPVVHLILSSKDRKLSVQLVEFLNRLGSSVPDGLENLAAEEQLKSARNADIPLCPDLKSFGVCEGGRREKRCAYRHAVLPEVDHPESWSHLPCEGEVRIFVTRVVTASHFYAWILQHWEVPPGAKKVDKAAIKENTDLQDAMLYLAEYLSEPENHAPLMENATPKIGQVYGLEVDVECFQRVLVLSVARAKSGPAQVTVMHMDYGGQSTVAVTRLLLLPPRLCQLRPFAVEVYCCRIQPQDHDVSWTFQAGLASHQLFMRKELVGRVVLRLGNTLWLDPLVLREELRSVDVEVNAQHVRTSLIQQGWACNNPGHVENLRKLATEAGLPVPSLPTGKQEHADETLGLIASQQCTAFLETSGYTHAYIWKVYSPSHFYVQPFKFNSCLDVLEDDILAAVEGGKVKKLQSPKVGDPCLAHISGGDRWYRAQVLKFLDREQVEVSFPDYGDTATCPLDQLLSAQPWMLLLPYQAVECCLAGIRPPGAKASEAQWSPEARRELEDFGFDDKDVTQVRCFRVARTTAGDRPGALRYEVFLFDTCDANRVSVADKLVHLGLAVATDLPELDFDPKVPHTLSLLEGDVASGETDSDYEHEDDAACRKRLEEHVYNIFTQVRDKVLVPAAQKLLEKMDQEDDALEHAGAVERSEPETASGPLPRQTTAAKEATLKTQLPMLDYVHKTVSRHSLTAPVTWWQDDNFVYVDAHIRNVATYKLCISATVICLKIATAENEFMVHEKLFAPIKPDSTKVVQKPNSVRVTLEKVEAKLVWRFLIGQRQKVPYIRYDFDHLVLSDDEDENCCGKDSTVTEYVRPKSILPYDPVAHDERALEIDDSEEHVHDPIEDMYHSLDPNNIFEG